MRSREKNYFESCSRIHFIVSGIELNYNFVSKYIAIDIGIHHFKYRQWLFFLIRCVWVCVLELEIEKTEDSWAILVDAQSGVKCFVFSPLLPCIQARNNILTSNNQRITMLFTLSVSLTLFSWNKIDDYRNIDVCSGCTEWPLLAHTKDSLLFLEIGGLFACLFQSVIYSLSLSRTHLNKHKSH